MLPKGRIFLSFGIFSLLGWFCPFGLDRKITQDLALAGEGSSQGPPAHKNNLGSFFLWAFPFERPGLAQAFPSCKETWKNQPQGLKTRQGLAGVVL